ncbi:hypothetical protein AAMO2058_001531000 [Amorphochlora amoebiformis]|mmetsp:Transcript_17043/g.27084  ORF Transcript_17043/g.27084 Transcript_17043/m.27084 type:complete len:484 (-) Transcript_17043:169-1620(-)
MQNSDFRKLLEQKHEVEDKPQETEEQRRERESRRRQKKLASYKRWQERKAALEAKYAKSSYRDRAKERREDKKRTGDDELKKYAGMSVEKTKFLGGDVEHTHLVKGLDFALLQRYKEELEREQTEKLENAYEEMQAKRKKKAKQEKVKKAELAKKPKISFETHLARAVYNVAITKEAIEKEPLSTFIPGRMTFEFDLDPEFGSDVPTTIVHSKDSAMEIEERVTGIVPPLVFNRVTKILTFLREGSKTLKNKKGRKKDMRNGKVPKSAVGTSPKPKIKPTSVEPDDEDIFGDAGRDYEPSIDKSHKAKNYFSAPPKATPKPAKSSKKDGGVKSKADGGKGKESRKSQKKESLFRGFENDKAQPKSTNNNKKGALMGLAPIEQQEDSYMECYPTMTASFEILGGVESDEEEEPATARGAKRKIVEDNKSRRWGAKQRDEQREARALDKEWGAIQKILKDKHPKKKQKKTTSAKRQRILKGFVGN